MQDVTHLPFLRLIADVGPPDYFFTEYFRVHSHSTLEPHILASITENESGRPIFAQIIGESLVDLKRTVQQLRAYPIAGIDLNLGCPAPKVYKKNVGGGLLRDPDKIESILALLRSAIEGLFTVKMRIGFEKPDHFDAIISLLNEYEIDLLSLHGRTVREKYRSEVHYEWIKRAVQTVSCPVLANGNITSAGKAAQVLQDTGSAGVMIGRSALRNPWIFRQIREYHAGGPIFKPHLKDVRAYLDHLYRSLWNKEIPEKRQVARIKKYLNFVGLGVDPQGRFLHQMRRARTEAELFSVFDRHLLSEGRGDLSFPEEPYEGLLARPNCEKPLAASLSNHG